MYVLHAANTISAALFLNVFYNYNRNIVTLGAGKICLTRTTLSMFSDE